MTVLWPLFWPYLQQHVRVEAQRGDEVDPVERRLEEVQDGGRHHEADDDLEREPDVARELNVGEGLVREGLRLVERPVGDVPVRVAHGDVAYHGHPTIRVRLQAKREDRGQDEEHGGH